MKDKVCLVTGANTGIGRVSAVELAKRGAHVVLACRAEAKARPVLDEIEAAGGEASFLRLDLGDLGQVREAAQAFLQTGRPLHVLMNNAGLAGQRGLTKDGFELAFGVNHLGPYLFTRLLLDRVVDSAPARIVNVSSRSHYRARLKGGRFDEAALKKPTKSVSGMREYEVSKLANVLFTKRLARDLDSEKVTTYTLHPGVVATDIWRRIPQPIRWLATLPMVTVEEGARTQLHCATAPELSGETGLYYDKCEAREPSRHAQDEALQDWLWDRSAEWVGLPA